MKFATKFLLVLLSGVALLGVALAWACIAVLDVSPKQVWDEMGRRSPNELIRYADAALAPYEELHAIFRPVLLQLQQRVERPVVSVQLPQLGKGRQPARVGEGRVAASVGVNTADELRQALQQAHAGMVIELAPGTYRFQKSLKLGGPGSGLAPIVVRAAVPDTTRIEMNTVEGFLVDQPYWVFEDLTITGVCLRDSDCEHAFHVVGPADFFVLRNSVLENFNAPVKINGVDGRWPDHGLLSHNTLSNARPRKTSLPVVGVDLVGGNFWHIDDNLVRNFVKEQGDQVSYGLFVKGGGEGARIERNLVICSASEISRTGVRVGISFGGGGTGPAFCRADGCEHFEHSNGLAANNIVAHCNDVGLDVNHSTHILLAHNTLINTSGISLRGEGAQAQLYGNLFEGKVMLKNGSSLKREMNQAMQAEATFAAPDQLNLAWRKAPERVPSVPAVADDFCGKKRPAGTFPGALEGDAACSVE
ncbi:right-handed parallel beta-helix repeat-containing protein [Roseateles koreensis]|uniref:Right handed beta helix domain-containing protein n=1 Tax=Roseateles koreensis TaxID=2987526 RepID=A0ABT5KPY1_9BURK|nr:hypothetical protein [Roseateles koreensis]MDC8784976.1 hypothetical protein [Roseateles koreensis]